MQEKTMAWIAAKVVRRHCPACEQAVNWQAADVLELAIAPCEQPSGTEIPVVPLVCPNCGYLTLFSAKAIGLVS
jgi:hypothetical protein